MSDKKTVHVVPHSHWDREWYFTFDDANVLLVENMDGLIEVLEGDPDFPTYVFDGQASIVEEYLRLRPENADRLAALIGAGRIHVGPWHTQTDTLIVDRECIIRNLLVGSRICSELGHSMSIGYLPDVFGQNSYLPSMFTEFGIHDAVAQRGFIGRDVAQGLNFLWRSPDGRTVHANNIWFGYGPGKFLEPSQEYLAGRLRPMIDTLDEMSKGLRHLLLPSGGDQVYVREHFPETTRWLSEHDPEFDYKMSSYEDFMAAVWEDFPNPATLDGEFFGCEKSRIHNTIRSQRQDIKSLNHRVESKVIRGLEPLSTIGVALGMRYPAEWLGVIWRAVFDSQAHDSMGGCNSDTTNAEIMMRLGRAERMTDGLTNVVKKQIARSVAETVGSDIALAFNLLPTPRTELVRTVLFSRDSDVSFTSLDGEALPAVKLTSEYISGGRRVIVTAEGDLEEEVPGYYRTELLARIPMPALGYTTCRVVEGESESEDLVESAGPVIDNGIHRIDASGGSVTISHHGTGRTVQDGFRFEGVADAGDSYDFSPLRGDEPVWSGTVRVVSTETSSIYSRMVVEHDLPVAQDLQAREAGRIDGSLTIVTTMELMKDDDVVRVTHDVDNDVKDHRIRVVHPVLATETYADQGFGVMTRPKDSIDLPTWREQGFAEAPVPIYPIQNWVVAGEDVRVGLITRGLKEYELTDEGIALTLFRACGLLGRDDLEWRPGRASGINNVVVHTPDAQMQGPISVQYGLRFANGDDVGVDWATATDRYYGSTLTYQLQELNSLEDRLERFEVPQPFGAEPESFSAAEVRGDVHVSAVKQAEDGGGTVIRVYNPGQGEQSVSVQSTPWPTVQGCTLAEAPTDAAEAIAPQGYASYRLT